MGCILPNDKGVGPGLLENWSRAECLHHEFLTSCRLSFKNLKRVLTYDSVTLSMFPLVHMKNTSKSLKQNNLTTHKITVPFFTMVLDLLLA